MPMTIPGMVIGTKARKSSSPRPGVRVRTVIHAMTAVRPTTSVAAAMPSTMLLKTAVRVSSSDVMNA